MKRYYCVKIGNYITDVVMWYVGKHGSRGYKL